MKSIFKIFKIFTPQQQKYCGLILVAMIIGALFEAAGIGAILPLISIMSEPDFLNKHPIIMRIARYLHIYSHNNFIIFSSGMLILFYVVKNIYMAWQVRMQIRFSMKNQVYYAGQLLNVYLNKPYLYHLEYNSAVLRRNVDVGAMVIFSNLVISLFTVLTEIITAVAIWGMLILIDPFTSLVVAGVLGTMMAGILRFFRRRISKRGELQNKYSAIYLKWLNQGLGAIKEIKVLQKEKYFLQQFNKAYDRYGKANSEFMVFNQMPKLMIELMVISGLMILIITKIALGVSPMDIVPVLGVLSLAAFRLMPCANRILSLLNGMKFQMPLFDELYEELLEIKNRRLNKERPFSPKVKTEASFLHEIRVENLRFRYLSGNKDILTDISFSIPQGSFVGIVGPSGAGKTTFIDILLGLLMPTEGAIYSDDVNIYNDIHVWQSNLAYVPQNIYLIDGSIKDNIALGIENHEINNEKIKQVLHMAELYDFVETLPEGINTSVGERGVKLSGGQRQRIGIARALYYDPKILVLDEATSALDNETEKSITDTILKLKGKMTIIAIAHRVTTLDGCDFRIEFEAGKARVIK